MSGIAVKVCGLREVAHLLAVAEAGADYAGFVFAESRRQIAPEHARELVRALGAALVRPKLVGVFVNASPDYVNATADRCGLDLVQLSGDESAEYCSKIERPMIRTVHVSPSTTADGIEKLITAQRMARPGAADIFLLDTGANGLYGGTGCTFDWLVAREVAARQPVMVAGGLTRDNVGRLVREVHPAGVDVSSGVERDGRKDESLILAFVAEARKAGEEN
ncbi:phosphoribosylanthranilate isomerase [Candidatus Bipolaricaulota bacterium]|nr:phosphoribosylanthranilate isomerase [Candidatus Bipolaricaulota bacterium]